MGSDGKPLQKLKFGDVCEGWTPGRWADELRRKAACCAVDHPQQADEYRRWAAEVERKAREARA